MLSSGSGRAQRSCGSLITVKSWALLKAMIGMAVETGIAGKRLSPVSKASPKAIDILLYMLLCKREDNQKTDS